MHKPINTKFIKRRVYVKGIDEIWTADLVDMRTFAGNNGGVKYLLTVIDVFSKYGWIVPLKVKTGEATVNALKHIFKLSDRKPGMLWVDKGREFYNKDVKSLVQIYSTENEEKSSVAERWNRTMKDAMFKYFTANSTNKYIDVLDTLVDKYNNNYHSSIKMTPTEASQKENETKVWRNLYPDVTTIIKPKLKTGDRVRITKKKALFDKGYTARWTRELFTISKVLYTHPPTYKINDDNGDEIQGSFYEKELQKSSITIFKIEKVIKTQGQKSLVKWLGYPVSANSWVNNKEITKF